VVKLATPPDDTTSSPSAGRLHAGGTAAIIEIKDEVSAATVRCVMDVAFGRDVLDVRAVPAAVRIGGFEIRRAGEGYAVCVGESRRRTVLHEVESLRDAADQVVFLVHEGGDTDEIE
jgi:hypothetical protein